MKVYFKILGIPKPKQSFRMGVNKHTGNIMKYQSKKVTDEHNNIKFDIMSQLPAGFVPLDCPLAMRCIFVFPLPKTTTKKKREFMAAGNILYKDTRPDLQDNLTKGVADAMEGVVFINDSRIAQVESKKIYGDVPRTELWIWEL